MKNQIYLLCPHNKETFFLQLDPHLLWISVHHQLLAISPRLLLATLLRLQWTLLHLRWTFHLHPARSILSI